MYVYDQKKKTKKLYFRNIIPSGKITQNILNDYKKDQIIETEIKNITEFGIFIVVKLLQCTKV